MKADMALCLRTWADELNARANRVRALIGDKHWLTDGHHKEYIVRDFLSRHLSPRIHLSRGFICPPDPENPASGEIDILMSDFEVHPPWFNEGGVVIAAPASVVGQLHVKTTFGLVELSDVFLSAGKAYLCAENYVEIDRIWTGGLFFHYPKVMDAQTLERNVESWIGYFVDAWPCGKLSPSLFPNCVAVLGGPVIFFERDRDRSAAQIHARAFDCGELAPAVMLADMFEHFQAGDGKGQKRGALTSLLERTETKVVFNRAFQLKAKRRRRRQGARYL